MQTIRPAKNQLFCKPEEATTKTKSGLFVPDGSAERPKIAEVVNSGSDEYTAGDKIVYKVYATNEIKLNGEEYFIIDGEDVLGKVLDIE